MAARENIALCEELNFPFWLGTGLIVLGANRARLGDEGGLADLDRAFAILMQYGNRGGGSMGFAVTRRFSADASATPNAWWQRLSWV